MKHKNSWVVPWILYALASFFMAAAVSAANPGHPALALMMTGFLLGLAAFFRLIENS